MNNYVKLKLFFVTSLLSVFILPEIVYAFTPSDVFNLVQTIFTDDTPIWVVRALFAGALACIYWGVLTATDIFNTQETGKKNLNLALAILLAALSTIGIPNNILEALIGFIGASVVVVIISTILIAILYFTNSSNEARKALQTMILGIALIVVGVLGLSFSAEDLGSFDLFTTGDFGWLDFAFSLLIIFGVFLLLKGLFGFFPKNTSQGRLGGGLKSGFFSGKGGRPSSDDYADELKSEYDKALKKEKDSLRKQQEELAEEKARQERKSKMNDLVVKANNVLDAIVEAANKMAGIANQNNAYSIRNEVENKVISVFIENVTIFKQNVGEIYKLAKQNHQSIKQSIKKFGKILKNNQGRNKIWALSDKVNKKLSGKVLTEFEENVRDNLNAYKTLVSNEITAVGQLENQLSELEEDYNRIEGVSEEANTSAEGILKRLNKLLKTKKEGEEYNKLFRESIEKIFTDFNPQRLIELFQFLAKMHNKLQNSHQMLQNIEENIRSIEQDLIQLENNAMQVLDQAQKSQKKENKTNTNRFGDLKQQKKHYDILNDTSLLNLGKEAKETSQQKQKFNQYKKEIEETVNALSKLSDEKQIKEYQRRIEKRLTYLKSLYDFELREFEKINQSLQHYESRARKCKKAISNVETWHSRNRQNLTDRHEDMIENLLENWRGIIVSIDSLNTKISPEMYKTYKNNKSAFVERVKLLEKQDSEAKTAQEYVNVYADIRLFSMLNEGFLLIMDDLEKLTNLESEYISVMAECKPILKELMNTYQNFSKSLFM